ncbi:MAG: hypothetical protein NWE98_09665 [Candidatus Bathyarchaeota archaeon]|nr:hypothetical protein [Candidatus Bathyarchaeota archaeon]
MWNRKGTAEVVGSILFIMILMFFFANVYLWHDAAVKDANAMFLKQAKAGMELRLDSNNLYVTTKGSDVDLSRLWILKNNGEHYFAVLDGIRVQAGKSFLIVLDEYSFKSASGAVANPFPLDSNDRLKVFNTLGVSVEITK